MPSVRIELHFFERAVILVLYVFVGHRVVVYAASNFHIVDAVLDDLIDFARTPPVHRVEATARLGDAGRYCEAWRGRQSSIC